MKHDLIINSEGKATRRPTVSFATRLAASMAQPIRRRLNYAGLARKVFHVEQLPAGALPIYDKDIDVTKCFDDFTLPPTPFQHNRYHIDSSGKAKRGIRGRRVTIPKFEVYSNPTVRIKEVKQRRFNLIDRNVWKAKQQLMSQEDEQIFKALDDLGKDK